MTAFLKNLFFPYLVYLSLALLLIAVGLFIAKKKGLLENKKLIVYVIISIVVLTLPALLGFLDYSFMPYGYLSLLLLYAVAGFYHTRFLTWVFKEDKKFLQEIGVTFVISLTAMLLFALFFNLCSELQYGIWAATSLLALIFVFLFQQTYELFLYIPEPVYKIWRYAQGQRRENYEDIDLSETKLVTMELFRLEEDEVPLQITLKIPDQMLFSDWAKTAIDNYNAKNTSVPIDTNENDPHTGWIFYAHTFAALPKRYIDYEKTVRQNKIKENDFIIAKRIKENTGE